MLTIQDTRCEVSDRQGRRLSELSELRRQLANPGCMTEQHRQRLLDLAGRLASVRNRLGRHVQVDLSSYALSALSVEAYSA